MSAWEALLPLRPQHVLTAEAAEQLVQLAPGTMVCAGQPAGYGLGNRFAVDKIGYCSASRIATPEDRQRMRPDAWPGGPLVHVDLDLDERNPLHTQVRDMLVRGEVAPSMDAMVSITGGVTPEVRGFDAPKQIECVSGLRAIAIVPTDPANHMTGRLVER